VLGGLASVAVTRFAASQLFGVAPDDATPTALAVVLVLATALVSSWLPARRAGKVDPATVLASD
jgi:ABC-type lipoprotein release transport system permease subunit